MSQVFENASKISERDRSLDFVKGFLVLGMILFHVGTFAIQSKELRALAVGDLLSFVSGSWVFVTGFVIALHYGPRYWGNKINITQRLVVRALKIIGLFIVSNTVASAVGWQTSSWSFTSKHLAVVFSTGGGQLSSFEILVGIGYLLLLGPVLLELFAMGRMVATTALVIVSLSGSFGVGITPNGWLLICGIWGVLAGIIFNENSNYKSRVGNLEFLKLFGLLLLGISIHYVLFVFDLASRQDILAYILGIICINAFVYYAASHIGPTGRAAYYIRLLGRYSLFSYLWQMAIIWMLVYGLKAVGVEPNFLREVFLVTLFVLLSVAIVDYLKNKIVVFKIMYNFVFS